LNLAGDVAVVGGGGQNGGSQNERQFELNRHARLWH
jgi:hypothetical protein